MIWKNSRFLLLVLLLFSCKQEKEKTSAKLPAINSFKNTTELIEVQYFNEIAKNANIKIIDFRKEEKYVKGHIPNALHIWRTDIEDATQPYKGMASTKEAMEKLLQRLGIQENDSIIIYDDMGLCDASRLWWVLKTYNFTSIQLLNGGWHAWKENGGQTSIEIPEVNPSNFKFSESRSKQLPATRSDILKILRENSAAVILDTRTIEEYSGQRLKKGAKRSGRIPRSKNIDWMNAIDETNAYKFRSLVDLEKIYAPLIPDKNTPVITYCHTGVRSAHTTFVLTELLGYTNVKNYDGSWSEWSYYENLPIEKDSITTVLN